MRTIIAGSRDITDYEAVSKLISITHTVWVERGIPITEVVSGRARGVDRLGERWAREQGIPIKPFPAQWDVWGKRAGFIRNEEMAAYAQALIAIKHPGISKGTDDMIKQAKARGLMIIVHVIQTMKGISTI